MSIIDKQKLMFANMMLGGGLPYLSQLVKASPQFRALKNKRVELLAYRAELRAKSEAIRRAANEQIDAAQRQANERVDAAQREANARIDALQAEMDQKLDELSRAAEDLFSDAGLEDLFEALKEPEPPPAAPAVSKPSTVHVLTRPAGDPPATE